jgi:hypothetical protein
MDHAASILINPENGGSKTLVSYITTWSHNTEDSDLNLHRLENVELGTTIFLHFQLL